MRGVGKTNLDHINPTWMSSSGLCGRLPGAHRPDGLYSWCGLGHRRECRAVEGGGGGGTELELAGDGCA